MKYIDIVFTGPPTAEIAQFVSVTDDRGAPVPVGEWLHDGAFWRYRIPTELVPRMVLSEEAQRGSGYPMPGAPELGIKQGDAPIDLRKRLREKIAAAPLKQQPSATTPDAPPVSAQAGGAAVREQCPDCKQFFDPIKDSLIACPSCGEDKCTAECIPNPGDPCLDCQALQVTPAQGGYDAAAQAATSRVTAGRLFDNQYHGKPGQAPADDDDEDEG